MLLLLLLLFFSFKFQEEDNYLSYESFPVLCCDVASILDRHPKSMFANRLLTAAVNTIACATVSPKNRTRNYPTSSQH